MATLSTTFARLSVAGTLALLAGACAGNKPESGPKITRPDTTAILPGDPVDLNGDGVYDGVAVDSNGDGKADGVDTNADGIADEPLPGGPPLPGSDAGTPMEMCPPTNPYCAVTDAGAPPSSCGDEKFDLNPVGVNVMVAMDGSNSMNAYWTQVQEAVRDMILANPTTDYGMHIFWGVPVDDFFKGVSAGFNFCGQTRNEVLDPAPHQQTKVLPFMGPQAPGQGNSYYDFTPVIDPLTYYLENKSSLEDPKRTNYLVFITDGNDNCFGTVFASKADKLLAYEKIAVELGKRHVRVLPIGFDAAGSQMSGLGTQKTTNTDALNTLAKFGGTGLTEALAADNADDLRTALKTVAQRVRPCRFSIPATLDPSQNLNPFELDFFLAGKKVDRDREQTEGWNFVDGNTSEVEFYGQACEAIRFGTNLEARKGCSSDVCGTAATQVTTKPRAVQYLLDRSSNMNECSVSGSYACAPKAVCSNSLFTAVNGQCAGGGGNLGWWGLMARSIANSVVDTVNDDVEFGLRMFPSAKADSCTVNDMPEVPAAQDTEITMIRSLLSNTPNADLIVATQDGPIVDGLEKVAANPGRIAATGVAGALIVVSDGGDTTSCGVEQADAVTRVSAAAKSLLDKGVKTYVIRFGTHINDELLRAIVNNGGTAVVDPTNPKAPPYLDAPDETTLNKLLDQISQELATCAFQIGDLKQDADKSKVNLYLNGQVIPYDTKGAKKEGWGWSNKDQTDIQMYGDACTQFKTNRTTSLVVEFGCNPVVVL